MTETSEFLSTIASLRATRWFTDQPVPPAVVARIIDVVRWTGSARNRQPWRFAPITDADTRRRLSRLGDYAGHLAGAPLVVLVATDPDLGGRDTEFDAGRACQNLMLAAHGLGLGSCPVTLYPEHNARAAAALVRLPAPWVVNHAVALGYPGTRPAGTSAIPTGRHSSADLTITAPDPTAG